MTTLLVVDDSKANRRLVGSMLKTQGYQIEEASNGQEAIAYLAQNPVDLIISDVAMPFMDGVNLCQAIREHIGQMPVIILTAHYDNQTRYSALRAGADVYLTKPVPKPQLIQHVRDLLEKKQPALAS